MFRLALYFPLLSSFGTRERHKIQPCIVGSLPLTEACPIHALRPGADFWGNLQIN